MSQQHRDRAVRLVGSSSTRPSAKSGASRRARRLNVDPCSWCRGPVYSSRVDARYCSTSCRQAAHRASIRRVELDKTSRPLRFAYADPPYIGNSRLYRDHPDYAGEVDHVELVSRLGPYDGWALSCSARSLATVAAIAVARIPGVRVAIWTRSPRPHATARVINAYEAVVWAGGRDSKTRASTPDVLSVTPRRRPTHPGWLVGSKPPAFCEWVFDLLGAGDNPGDTLDDLYPGSGIVARSWALRLARPVASLGDERDESERSL